MFLPICLRICKRCKWIFAFINEYMYTKMVVSVHISFVCHIKKVPFHLITSFDDKILGQLNVSESFIHYK